MEDKIIIKKHAQKYCTSCITNYGKYYPLKTLYGRGGKTWEKSNLYQCKKCKLIAIDDDWYEEMRLAGNHVIKKLTTVIE